MSPGKDIPSLVNKSFALPSERIDQCVSSKCVALSMMFCSWAMREICMSFVCKAM